MFDADSFLRVEEYVIEAEAVAEQAARADLVREQPLGIAEIAELLGENVNTVYGRLRTARQQFDMAVRRHHARHGLERCRSSR